MTARKASRGVTAAVLLLAVAALAATVTWAVTRADDDWSMARLGPGMMGYAARDGGEPVRDMKAARAQAARFAERLDLRADEVMRFERNYYVELVEKSGALATEVLIDPATGAVGVEYGPAMMWNTRYGMMAGAGMGAGMMGGAPGRDGYGPGMMGGRPGDGYGPGMMGGGARADDPTRPATPGARGSVSAAEAERIATRWLRSAGDGDRAGEAERFPGYYTLHTLRGGRVTGMLSVNGATGAVWPHWWHGRFLSMSE